MSGGHETKEGAIAEAIDCARLDAFLDEEPVNIWVCVGPPCRGGMGEECASCERIVVAVDGSVNRESRRN